MQLRFLTLRVVDATRSRRFYEALGLGPARGDATDLPMLDAGGVRLVLATDAALQAHAPPLSGPGGSVLVSLNVGAAAAVDTAHAAGLAAGGSDLRPPHEPAWGGRAAWLRDPDGHAIEVVWNPRLDDGMTKV
ncbi:MAG: VOC family protein [Myxococcota bacterium]|nr:VOC family protein [Myxococcota bacterium]